MMSKLKAPIYSLESSDKNPVIHHQTFFGNFYFDPCGSNVELDLILISSNCPSYIKKTAVFSNLHFHLQSFVNFTRIFFRNCLENCFNIISEDAMQPNHGGVGVPNPPVTKKIFLSNFEYDLVNKQVEYSDQHMGAGQPILSNKDVKFMKICTIISINYKL